MTPFQKILDHQDHCVYLANIPRDALLHHASHFQSICKSKKLTCHILFALHTYYCRSNGDLPTSLQALAHFWNTGNIQTSNINLLCHTITQITSDLSTNTCGLCWEKIKKGDRVYKLPCGDMFHVSHQCDQTQRYFASSHTCPTCGIKINLNS